MDVSMAPMDVSMAMSMSGRPDDAGQPGARETEEQDQEQAVQPELAEGIPSHGIQLKPEEVRGTSC